MLNYGKTYRYLHWSMAILFIISIALIETKGVFNDEALNDGILTFHIQSGLILFALVWFRIGWRLTHSIPPIQPALHTLHKLGVLLVHIALYAMLIVIPFLGIVALQTRGINVNFLGFALPTIISESEGLQYSLALISYHQELGNIMIYSILAHLAFSLIHHFIWQDNTLTRMLPMSARFAPSRLLSSRMENS
ncbi:hypothetical protein BI364_07840 [Acidihalobacter yilgarnensis]|uniref:Cytochrome b561 bacterial/Ni-hydrogenase domain-containing protein n=1 Tax=Acidihalobacter yilgarnensis TaxID=2819280 RepID=A0A1D8IN52_9GAMM|nr:cytochrome b/b6 domain-containing protein [Acidihalobacter yilgarnensis]AOU97887.1 hypothetical protein BI364_07840 [Acidihalobacter yilgarnensis]